MDSEIRDAVITSTTKVVDLVRDAIDAGLMDEKESAALNSLFDEALAGMSRDMKTATLDPFMAKVVGLGTAMVENAVADARAEIAHHELLAELPLNATDLAWAELPLVRVFIDQARRQDAPVLLVTDEKAVGYRPDGREISLPGDGYAVTGRRFYDELPGQLQQELKQSGGFTTFVLDVEIEDEQWTISLTWAFDGMRLSAHETAQEALATELDLSAACESQAFFADDELED